MSPTDVLSSDDSAPIRVMIVDDHKTILWGLERLVESAAPRMQVVATASACGEVLAAAQAGLPDVIILDLDLGGESSLDILPSLLEACRARVLILTGERSCAVHQAAICAGARGVVVKDESAETLLHAISRVYAGDLWIDQKLMGGMVGLLNDRARAAQPDEGARRIASLTAREREIIRALISNRGAKGMVIAEALGISEHTLRNHLTVIYDKLALRNRIDLFAFATEHGLDSA